MGQIRYRLSASAKLRRPLESCTPARNDSYADDLQAPFLQPALPGTTHDKLTSGKPLCNGCALLPRAFAFVCHFQVTVQIVRNAKDLRSARARNRTPWRSAAQ